MYCSNCEKESNLTLCEKCQKEFQDIEDQEYLDRLADQDQAEYESERDYYDEEYEAQCRYDRQYEQDETDRLYDVHMDRWEMENI